MQNCNVLILWVLCVLLFAVFAKMLEKRPFSRGFRSCFTYVLSVVGGEEDNKRGGKSGFQGLSTQCFHAMFPRNVSTQCFLHGLIVVALSFVLPFESPFYVLYIVFYIPSVISLLSSIL